MYTFTKFSFFKKSIVVLIISVSSFFSYTLAQTTDEVTVIQDTEVTYLAEVESVERSSLQEVPNTDVLAEYQTVVVKFLDKDKVGQTQTIVESSFPMEEGDKVYVKYTKTSDGTEYYAISEPYRLPALLWLLVLFIVCVLLLGGKQGFLGLVALFISFCVIFNLLFPQMLSGGNVVVIATLGALLSLFVVMYLTHGFTRLTTSAFLGSTVAIVVTVLLATYAVHLTALTGFSSEESVFLNLATGGKLDFVALLIGGIIIGVIGVVDDVAITQSSVVNELYRSNPSLTRRDVYFKALKVGKDHMGSVINTLILAYTGASLPLVLLLYISATPTLELINREMIAVEIVRSIVGSIGLLCTVPLTTLIAVMLMKGATNEKSSHTHHH